MAGNITIPHTFAGDTGPEALSLLDTCNQGIYVPFNTLQNFANYYADTGAVNAIVVPIAAPQNVASYAAGLYVDVSVANSNTIVAPTLNINGLGAKTIVDADGSALTLYSMVAGGIYRMMYDGANFRVISPMNSSGTFTATATGIAGSPTGTALWRRIGGVVNVLVPFVSGTSNATTFTITGLPPNIVPNTIIYQQLSVSSQDNSTRQTDSVVAVGSSAGVGFVMLLHASTTGWTASGTKATGTFVFTYLMN